MTKRSIEDAQLEVIENWQYVPRASFVVPEKKKRKYNDGIPVVFNPKNMLRNIIHRVIESYRYKPLGMNEDIRVLILERGGRASPGRIADPIVCRLLPCALPPPREQQGKHKVPIYRYEALSYYWGQDAIPTETIIVNTDGVKKKFAVRPNLYAALIELRSATSEIILWVDAICIHQADIQEKTLQVSKMHEIYSKAESTCIWLGVGNVDKVTKDVDLQSTTRTFEFIRQILGPNLDELVTDKNHAKDWYSFVELMRNRWFSRRWVVQELAFAQQATIHWGKEVMQWRDFADAVALFVEKHDQIDSLLKASTENPGPIGDMRALGANILVEANSTLFRRSAGGQIIERKMSLEVLVSKLLAFEATDSKDIVYAVLSIASDTPYSGLKTAEPSSPLLPPDMRITPNYNKEEAEIFGDFIDYCIETSESLDIICRHWAPAPKGRRRNTSTTDLDAPRDSPTWVSVITGSAFGGPEVLLEGRCNADSLVGTTSRKHHRNYNASGDLKPSYRMEKIAQPKQMIMYVKGIRLDVVTKLSPRVAEGDILQECLEMGGWTPNKWDDDEKHTMVPDALWRTLVADRGPDGTNTTHLYHRTCLDCFSHISQNGVLKTMALIDNPSTASTMVKFLKRVQEVVWNRKFLLSQGGEGQEEEKKLFGLAPTGAQEGDIIVILFGCSVPVLLREKGPPEDRYYNFVGEVYIHGKMDGEALPKRLPEFPYKNFTEFKLH